MSDNPKGRPARTYILIGLAFSIFWVLYLAVLGPKTPGPRLEGTGTGQPASYSWELHDVNGRPVTLERYKGKTVFLNIWATWCPPCVEEMPSIARLAKDPRWEGKNIAFVCVSVDESADAVRWFLKSRASWKMDFYRADSIPLVYRTEGIPATFIISPDGDIVASQVGAAEWDRPTAIQFLEKLAAGNP